jgi:hypothetical protein
MNSSRREGRQKYQPRWRHHIRRSDTIAGTSLEQVASPKQFDFSSNDVLI